jgi:hypothetical protein
MHAQLNVLKHAAHAAYEGCSLSTMQMPEEVSTHNEPGPALTSMQSAGAGPGASAGVQAPGVFDASEEPCSSTSLVATSADASGNKFDAPSTSAEAEPSVSELGPSVVDVPESSVRASVPAPASNGAPPHASSSDARSHVALTDAPPVATRRRRSEEDAPCRMTGTRAPVPSLATSPAKGTRE